MYSLISMLIMGIFAILVFLLSIWFKELFSPASIVIAISAVFVIAALCQPALFKLQHIVDRWFLRDRYDNLQALKRFARETGDVTELKQLSSSLVTTVAHAMQSSSVYLLLPSTPTGGLETCACYGENSKGRLSFSATSRLMLTMKWRDSVIDSNDAEIPNIIVDGDRDALAMNRIELLVPLRTKQQLVGLLLIGDKLSKEHYSTEDRRLLYEVVSEVAPGIENAYLYQDVQREQEVLKKVTDGVLHAMSLATEMRDPYTAGHQRQVANLASEIARAMGLSEWEVEGIRIMGLLHDVGKPATLVRRPHVTFYGHEEVGEQMARKVCARLKMSRRERESVAWLVRNHLRLLDAPKMRPGRLRQFLAHPLLDDLCELFRADVLASSRDLTAYDFVVAARKDLGEEAALPAPLLTGTDLLSMGLQEGPLIGRVLRRVQEEQLEGTIASKQEALALARRLVEEGSPGQEA